MSDDGRLATDLLRLGLDPVTHRIRRPATLAIGLRAALFADLALAGAVGDDGRAPVPTGPAPAGERVLGALHRTVEQRPGVAWHRWYRHVAEDAVALAADLVAAGHWQDGAGRVRRAYVETQPRAVLALGQRVQAVGRGNQPAGGVHEVLLGALVVITGVVEGRPQPRLMPDLEAALAPFDDLEPTRRRAAITAVTHAQRLLRKGRLRRR